MPRTHIPQLRPIEPLCNVMIALPVSREKQHLVLHASRRMLVQLLDCMPELLPLRAAGVGDVAVWVPGDFEQAEVAAYL